MKQVWQARNGDIFDSEEECRDFEERFCGATGIKYIVDDKFVAPRDIEEEEKIMDVAQYIFIPKEVLLDADAVEKMEDRGFSCPYEPGVFAWDSGRGEWVNLEEEVARLKRYEEIIQEFTI